MLEWANSDVSDLLAAFYKSMIGFVLADLLEFPLRLRDVVEDSDSDLPWLTLY